MTPGYYQIAFLSLLKRKRWQRLPARYAVRVHKGVSRCNRAAVHSFVHWYALRYPAVCRLEIAVYPKYRFAHSPRHGRPDAIGIFWFPKNLEGAPYSPKIYVAAYGRGMWSVCHTLAHELSHYTEWARTGDSTERGKEQRADRLMREYDARA